MSITHLLQALNSDFLLVHELTDTPDPSGIISPYGRHASTPVRARVLAAGLGYTLPTGAIAPMLARVGDIVWLQFNAGTDIRIGGETYKMVQDRDLFAVEAPRE